MKRFIETPISRRLFLKQTLVGAATVFMVPWLNVSPVQGKISCADISGNLSIYNIHTEESLRIRYLDRDGNWIPNALSRLNQLFRCHYNHVVKPIDPDLFLLLDRIHTRLRAGRRPLQLISGYRSPEYNNLLLSTGSGVAKKSYHLKGMAADIQIKGIKLKKLFEVAKRMERGGVGLYSKFIHVDVGPVRYW
jgi:uncharacterized protein YcbK (DUF882 family)